MLMELKVTAFTIMVSLGMIICRYSNYDLGFCDRTNNIFDPSEVHLDLEEEVRKWSVG